MPATIQIVQINRAAAESLRRGHPWVWREAVVRKPSGTGTGDIVALTDSQGTQLGIGIFEANSPIAIRVWLVANGIKTEAEFSALFEKRLRSAIALRQQWVDASVTGKRLVHGEADGMPGIVIDAYEHVAVIRIDGEGPMGAVKRYKRLISDILGTAGFRTILQKVGHRFALFSGKETFDQVWFKEYGLGLCADLIQGQKTGAFLDQRENRRYVRSLVEQWARVHQRKPSVLNLFSYTGGFSLAAAVGGAADITSVDVAEGPLALSQQAFERNGLETSLHHIECLDVFVFLAKAKTMHRKWDIIVSDPPSFARSEKAVPQALKAYRNLHRACRDVLAPQGVLCASSCSSHVNAQRFLSTLEALDDARIVHMAGAGADHPVRPSWPEGQYLKFMVLQ